jgi:hypothetical protein
MASRSIRIGSAVSVASRSIPCKSAASPAKSAANRGNARLAFVPKYIPGLARQRCLWHGHRHGCGTPLASLCEAVADYRRIACAFRARRAYRDLPLRRPVRRQSLPAFRNGFGQMPLDRQNRALCVDSARNIAALHHSPRLQMVAPGRPRCLLSLPASSIEQSGQRARAADGVRPNCHLRERTRPRTCVR